MKKYAIFVIIAIFIVTLSSALPMRNVPVWYRQYTSLLFCLFLGATVFLWGFNKAISIFTGLCLFSTFFVAQMAPRSLMLLIQLDFGCLAAYGVSKLNARYRKWIIYSILGLVLLQAFWLMLQSNNLDPIFTSLLPNRVGMNELVGFSGSAGQLGTFFAITLPIALYTFPVVALLSIVGIAISKSSFAFVAGITASLFYFFTISRKLFVIGLIATIAAGVFFFKVEKLGKADFVTRFSVWKHAIQSTIGGKIIINQNGQKTEISTKPAFGFGWANFLRIFPYVPETPTFNYPDEKFTHAHNDFIEYFFELGYTGLAVMIAVILNLFYMFIKVIRSKEGILVSACLIAFMLNSTGNFCTQIATSGVLLMVYYGMLVGIYKEACNGKKAEQAGQAESPNMAGREKVRRHRWFRNLYQRRQSFQTARA